MLNPAGGAVHEGVVLEGHWGQSEGYYYRKERHQAERIQLTPHSGKSLFSPGSFYLCLTGSLG